MTDGACFHWFSKCHLFDLISGWLMPYKSFQTWLAAGSSICTPCLLSVHWTVILCHYHRLCRYCFGTYMWRQQLDPFCKQRITPIAAYTACSFSVLHPTTTWMVGLVSEGRLELLLQCVTWQHDDVSPINTTYLSQSRPNTLSHHNKWNQVRTDFQKWLTDSFRWNMLRSFPWFRQYLL